MADPQERVQELIDAIYTDAVSLKDGTWECDQGSCQDFIEAILELCEKLHLTPNDLHNREEQ